MHMYIYIYIYEKGICVYIYIYIYIYIHTYSHIYTHIHMYIPAGSPVTASDASAATHLAGRRDTLDPRASPVTGELRINTISLLTLRLLTLLDSNFPGNSIWALEFHFFKLRLCLGQTL